MAGNGRNSVIGNGTRHADVPPTPADVKEGAVDAAREWIAVSLASTKRVADWMERLQMLNTQAASAWTAALTACAQEVAQAKDPQNLMAVPTHMINHQWDSMAPQLSATMQDLLRMQTKWAEEYRAQVAGQTERLMTSMTTQDRPTGAGSPASLAALGQLQERWLAMNRVWIDTLGAAAKTERRT